ncbi:hypothetical protein STHERM_c15660 [Spirochaeta thermophila DSM 6192]|uniref:Glycosyl transferase group 1 n=1 Tax=Winmispira thermophila (strain ATCC 49972 / DSM 6192 / RI 19.B1) TaxID=665571 RepID=E0RN37_WINT6|nr:hypothetical protein STHERM_c15660 [Spirochaeta thermophila DSM 6192]
MIRLLFDVTRLGNVWTDYLPRGKRGIFRVIEELVKHLGPHSEVSLTLTSLAGKGLCGASYFYTKRLPAERQIPFAFPSSKLPAYASALILKMGRPFHDIYKRFTRKSWGTFSSIMEIPPSFFTPYDILHLPSFIGPSIPSLPIPMVITVHDLIPLFLPSGEDPLFRNFLIRKLGELHPEVWIHCISEATKKDLLTYAPHLDPGHVFVVPNGISSRFFRETETSAIEKTLAYYGLEPGTPYIVSLSTLQERKNLLTALRAFAAAKKEIPELRYVLIGYTPREEREKILTVLNELSIASHVIITGFLPDDRVRALYSAAKAFVFPSLYEGFGLPPLEAMACGLPVICSNTSSLPEVVGDAGILLDPYDIHGFSEAICRIVTDSELRQRLSQKGLERSASFTWRHTTDKLVEMYKYILEHD